MVENENMFGCSNTYICSLGSGLENHSIKQCIVLRILADGSGAGKSTFYNLYLAKYGIKFVNADLIAQEIGSENQEELSYTAAILATRIREDLITQGVSFW